LNSWITRGRKSIAAVGIDAMVMRPCCFGPMSPEARIEDSSSLITRRNRGSSSRPIVVGETPRRDRSSSGAPSDASRAWILRDTSKVAIVSPSRVPGADVDYLFAQVRVEQRLVDTSPNCGNMIAGVGPFAIEAGMVSAQDGETRVRIFNVNTGKLIEAKVATPGRQVVYDGNASIDGVPGTAAPIHLAFLGAAGSKTGKLLPTGRPLDRVDGIEISCVDAAMPVVLIRASDLGKTGYEKPAEFSADREFMRRLEALRIEAGKLMGIPDAADRVIPKPVLIAPPANGGTISARYFMPHSCHAALAITGSVAVATAAVTPGTLAHAIVGDHALPVMFGIEHPSGRLEVTLDHHPDYVEPAAYVVRTARRLFEGHVLVKASEIYLASSTAA
jgi:2-methylaconitate cis-trans-isomerase PrpF